jgi:hypothetical protein
MRASSSLVLQSTETTIEEDDEGEDDAAAASFVRSGRLDVLTACLVIGVKVNEHCSTFVLFDKKFLILD